MRAAHRTACYPDRAPLIKRARVRGVRESIVETVLLALAVMGVLGLLRFRFALRFWRRVRQFGYVYVTLIVVLAALSFFFGVRL